MLPRGGTGPLGAEWFCGRFSDQFYASEILHTHDIAIRCANFHLERNRCPRFELFSIQGRHQGHLRQGRRSFPRLRRSHWTVVVGIKVKIVGNNKLVEEGPVFTARQCDGVQPKFVDLDGIRRSSILRIAHPDKIGLAGKTGHTRLIAIDAVGWTRVIHPKPARIIVATVPTGAIPDDVNAGCGELHIILELGGCLIAPGAVGQNHRHAPRRHTPGEVFHPEIVGVEVIRLGLKDDEPVVRLWEQGAEAVEFHLAPVENIGRRRGVGNVV